MASKYDTLKNIVTTGNYSSLLNTLIENESIRLTVDTEQLFFEIDNKRIEISDLIKGYTEYEIKSLTNPLNKIYLSKDTRKLFLYDSATSKWNCVGDGDSSVKLTQAEYDALSEEEKNNGTSYYVETEEDLFNGYNIEYNSTRSGLKAKSVSAAIDELSIKADCGYMKLTQAEYDALSEEEKKNGTTYYVESDTNQFSAKNVSYDDTATSLGAVNIQDAIGKLNGKIISGGGGGGITYTLTKENNKIILNGADGSKTEVTDDNTTYSFVQSGTTLTITPSNGADPVNITLGGDISGKVDKEEGKGLSSNDYTNADKTSVSYLTSNDVPFKFAIDGEGNYGCLKADGSFIPF